MFGVAHQLKRQLKHLTLAKANLLACGTQLVKQWQSSLNSLNLFQVELFLLMMMASFAYGFLQTSYHSAASAFLIIELGQSHRCTSHHLQHLAVKNQATLQSQKLQFCCWLEPRGRSTGKHMEVCCNRWNFLVTFGLAVQCFFFFMMRETQTTAYKTEKKLSTPSLLCVSHYLCRQAYLKDDLKRQGAKVINAINCHPAVLCGWKWERPTSTKIQSDKARFPLNSI